MVASSAHDGLERQLEQPSRLRDAALAREGLDLRLEARQHEPAVPTARAPADRVTFEHGDVRAAPRQRPRRGEAGVAPAEDRHVRPRRKLGRPARRQRRGVRPEAALDQRNSPSARTLSRKTSVWRSTSSSVTAGASSAML